MGSTEVPENRGFDVPQICGFEISTTAPEERLELARLPASVEALRA
jgi:hypothetical protein